MKILVTISGDWARYEFREAGVMVHEIVMQMDCKALFEEIYRDHERSRVMAESYGAVSQN